MWVNKCSVCGKPKMKPHGCSEFCDKHFTEDQKAKKKVNSGGIFIIDKERTSRRRINSRVVDDNGNSLSDSKGIEYMKSKGDMYASRLKEYYK